jgi:hypothetical protein
MLDHGIHEFVFGAVRSRAEALLLFWERLGFRVIAEGRLDAQRCEQLYGHEAELEAYRLAHPGCETYGTGLVRLQCWSELRNQGLSNSRPIATGSRWMGLYTHDILQVRDAFCADSSRNDWNLWISPLVNAPLEKPAPPVDFWSPFVGLRETLVFGDDFRLAFIQRGGFDRPGFGTFDDSLMLKNTEGSHASLVQPPGSFDTDFYKRAFGYETAPFGEAHDSGDEPPTIAALNLHPGETFRVERLRAPEIPSGLLQVYGPHHPGPDRRDLSCAGCRNLGAYSVRTAHPDRFAEHVSACGAGAVTDVMEDEFGHGAFTFYAPDGYHWLASNPDD